MSGICMQNTNYIPTNSQLLATVGQPKMLLGYQPLRHSVHFKTACLLHTLLKQLSARVIGDSITR